MMFFFVFKNYRLLKDLLSLYLYPSLLRMKRVCKSLGEFSTWESCCLLPQNPMSAVISSIRLAIGLSEDDLAIERRPSNYFLKFKEEDADRFLLRQPFIICKSLLAVEKWDSECSSEEFAPEKCYLLLGSNSCTQALSTRMLQQHLKFLKLLRSLP